MTKLNIGDVMPDFSYQTPFGTGFTLAETAQKAPRTLLLFLRYYGCPLCQYDIHQVQVNYDELTADGGQVLVVLQSDPVSLAEQLGTADALPFSIICDPDQALYKEFAIAPAANMLKMADAKTIVKIVKATAAGYQHGAYEGNEQQLPAVFVMDENRKLTYIHYGKSAGDIPSVAEMKSLLKGC